MSAATVTPPLLTVNEFLKRPERIYGWWEELIDGEVILSPVPNKGHTHAASNVLKLFLSIDGREFRVLGKVACCLSPLSLLNTDAAVVLREHWDVTPDDSFLNESLALAIEIHWPTNTQTKLLRKIELYLEHGAEQCWIVYPKNRKVVVYLPDGTSDEVREEGAISFHGCAIAVRDLFV